MTTALLFQVIALPIVVAVGLFRPDLCARSVRAIDASLAAMGRRRAFSVVLVGALSLAINATLGLFVHEPVPAIHDEFAYLLGADTFAEGRLTNPTHPMWEHFESYHIIHRPTYQSKYPPGQSLFLALGQVVLGHPIWGAWISLALACGAVTWMLQAWVGPKWALIGGLIAVLDPLITLRWGQSYWGGAVAMLGGALLFGALRRILEHQRPRDAAILGLALVLLAHSRPYEGMVASIPAALVLVGWLFTMEGPSLPRFALRTALPMAIVLAAGLGWLGLYNQRVTGSPLTMPYQVWAEQVDHASQVQAGTAPGDFPAYSYNPAALNPPEDFEGITSLEEHVQSNLLRSTRTADLVLLKLARQGSFYVPLWAVMPLLFFLGMLRNRWNLLAAVTIVATLTATLVNLNAGHPHYSSPAAVMVFFATVSGLRWLCLSRGLLVCALLAIAVLASILYILVDWIPVAETSAKPWSVERAAIHRALMLDESDHLVLVRYRPDHNRLDEWVYNAAAIDDASVVWARDLGPERNAALLDFFEGQGRRTWLLEADADPPRLRPYPSDAAESSSHHPASTGDLGGGARLPAQGSASPIR